MDLSNRWCCCCCCCRQPPAWPAAAAWPSLRPSEPAAAVGQLNKPAQNRVDSPEEVRRLRLRSRSFALTKSVRPSVRFFGHHRRRRFTPSIAAAAAAAAVSAAVAQGVRKRLARGFAKDPATHCADHISGLYSSARHPPCTYKRECTDCRGAARPTTAKDGDDDALVPMF